jgi:prepilin-type N-terminal cleavage/methylation domain-containing protein/prepilin-type processing-associated H-X9-DG protein
MKRMRTLYVGKRRAAPGGFTLVELLVVIAIIGILVSLLLPAINMARESGRRSQCLTNMSNIAKACHGHNSLHGSFPPGVPVCTLPPSTTGSIESDSCQGPVWTVNILPQLEEIEMWKRAKDAYNDQSIQDPISWLADEQEVGNWTLAVYTCPTADRMTSLINEEFSKGNYAGCWGSDTYMNLGMIENRDDSNWEVLYMTDKPTAGVFGIAMLNGWNEKTNGTRTPWATEKAQPMGLGQGTTRAEIRDGTSTTLMISEVLGWDTSNDGRGGWVLNAPGATNFTAKYGPNSHGTDVTPMCEGSIPDSDPMYCGGTDDPQAAARSQHMNGVNVAFSDGSTKFINDTIDPSTWQDLATRDGHEVIQPDY